MLLLYDCYLPEKRLLVAERARGLTVGVALGLHADMWPEELTGLVLLTFRQVTVPLIPGLSPQARNADVLIHLVLICEGDVSRFGGLPRLCNAVNQRGSPLFGLRRSSVTVVTRSCNSANVGVSGSVALACFD